jgi:hypothetical protein
MVQHDRLAVLLLRAPRLTVACFLWSTTRLEACAATFAITEGWVVEDCSE